jgi:hypothetical protein
MIIGMKEAELVHNKKIYFMMLYVVVSGYVSEVFVIFIFKFDINVGNRPVAIKKTVIRKQGFLGRTNRLLSFDTT